jgi:hypothetical protein
VLKRAHAEGELLDCDGSWDLRSELVFLVAGCVLIYGALFATGLALYGRYVPAAISTLLAAVGGLLIAITWRRVASGQVVPGAESTSEGA